MTRLTALVVEDDAHFRESLEALVAREGFVARGAGSLAQAREILAAAAPDVILVDLKLPDGDGLSLLSQDAVGVAEVVVITGNASVDSAVDALRDGVVDYLTKPVDRARLKTVLANVARTHSLKAEVTSLRDELLALGRFGPMVGRSKAMERVYGLIERVAPTEATVLVTGESGTGKELAAQTIHRLSRRAPKPFVAVNCGAIAANLIESELFGHEKGSFTGADRRHEGVFERADGGTLFLDEVTEMPPELQVKLLRVLETGSFHRVGGKQPLAVDVRVVGATNRDPEEAVRAGALREDLFYRLNVFPIALPPLREREGDVALLAEHFLAEVNREQGTAKRWSSRSLRRLESHPWPGNVRELRNSVQRAAILTDDEVGEESLEGLSAASAERAVPSGEGEIRVAAATPVAEVERRLILATLEHFDGDKRRAAEALGISLKTLYNRLKVYQAMQGGA